ncbi:MAG: hypothetical protein EGQ32_06420 [Prevotella sp.]|nr:hypothetical protein [Prevotella sp.]
MTKTLYIYQQKKKGSSGQTSYRNRAELVSRGHRTAAGGGSAHTGEGAVERGGVAFWRDIRLARAFNLKKFWASAFFP